MISDEKKKLIAQLASTRHETIKALQGINDMTVIHQDGGWRVKDILGHLATWEREALATLQALQEGEGYYLEDPYILDVYNQSKAEARWQLDPTQIRMDWGMVRRDLQFAIMELNDQYFTQPFRFPWGAHGTASQLVNEMLAHEKEHVAEILSISNQPTSPAASPRRQRRHRVASVHGGAR